MGKISVDDFNCGMRAAAIGAPRHIVVARQTSEYSTCLYSTIAVEGVAKVSLRSDIHEWVELRSSHP
jgi:hypothetical protein